MLFKNISLPGMFLIKFFSLNALSHSKASHITEVKWHALDLKVCCQLIILIVIVTLTLMLSQTCSVFSPCKSNRMSTLLTPGVAPGLMSLMPSVISDLHKAIALLQTIWNIVRKSCCVL